MPDDAPTLVVCHGLTGGSHESYVRNVVAWLVKPKEDGGMGGRAVVVNVSRQFTIIALPMILMAVPRLRWRTRHLAAILLGWDNS